MYLTRDDPIRPRQTRSIWDKPDDPDQILKPLLRIKKQKKKASKKPETCVIMLFNYYLWNYVINFNTSIVILNFEV